MSVSALKDNSKLRIFCLSADSGGNLFGNFTLLISWERKVHIQIVERPQAFTFLDGREIGRRYDFYHTF